MATDEWLCKGPSGIQGEGVVGNNWHKCFNNYIPNIDKNCENSFHTESASKEYCYSRVISEIDTLGSKFNPENYSCIIKKNESNCEGKYVSIFKKEPKPPHYYSPPSENGNRELFMMDIPKTFETYMDILENDELKRKAMEQKQILIDKLKQQDLEQKRKIKQENDEKRRIFKLQLENEIKDEMKESIKQQLFGIDNEIFKTIQKQLIDKPKAIKIIEKPIKIINETPDDLVLKLQKLQEDINSINKQMEKHDHIELNETVVSNEKMLSNEKILSKIKKDQENNERLLRSYMTESKPQEINIKQILDNTEEFLIKLLSSPSIEAFSNKKCIWNNISIILLVALSVVCILYS